MLSKCRRNSQSTKKRQRIVNEVALSIQSGVGPEDVFATVVGFVGADGIDSPPFVHSFDDHRLACHQVSEDCFGDADGRKVVGIIPSLPFGSRRGLQDADDS